MFRQQRISLFIIVLGVLIAIGTGLNAHWYHDVKNKDLSFTSGPSISCNIDGYTFEGLPRLPSGGDISVEWHVRVCEVQALLQMSVEVLLMI